MNIFNKKTQIELAILNIDREYKVTTEIIIKTIYEVYEKDKQITFYPDDYDEDKEYDSEYLEKYGYFMGYDELSFSSYRSEKGGTILNIRRSILPNSDPTDEFSVRIELIFNNIPFVVDNHYKNKRNGELDNDFLAEINNNITYNKVKALIPDQFKVRTRVDNVG
nr:hypothetical protein [Pedobacter kyonggii]